MDIPDARATGSRTLPDETRQRHDQLDGYVQTRQRHRAAVRSVGLLRPGKGRATETEFHVDQDEKGKNGHRIVIDLKLIITY